MNGVEMRKYLITALLACCVLTACGDKKSEASKESATAPGPNLTQTPDVGKVEQVIVAAKGTGMTPGAAINDALKTAVAQVNGVKVDSTSVNQNGFAQVTATLDVETSEGKDSAKATATVQSQAFAERIITQSKGLVSTFKVVQMTPPPGGSGAYSVDIEASIAKFKGPADSGKIKIVVAPLRSEKQVFDIGGRQVPANEVLASIRQQIIDALSQTGRFSILDRQFEGELQNEMNMISSGKAVNTDFAKLGQALSADLVWIGVVNDLAYIKQVRKLQTSDRELVSYSGGWSVSQRMINLTTRQILQSNTLQGTPPPIAPTTLGVKFDETSTLKGIQSEIVKKAAEAILLRTFPISIVERDGNNVVLSQGGQAVSESGRYRIFLQGKEIKDPQTGQSLGNMESLCCDVVINRVTPNLSYGTLENVKADLTNVQPGALQVREAVAEKPAEKPVPAPVAEAPALEKEEVVIKNSQNSTASNPASAGTPKKGGKSEDW
jgi:curli biogenesis system outer membrane secretion channel CsgG